ncbi:hypothetical protein SNEBB_006317 [Seison nebaliae]|nr:hypothetical protein SNEBB_006317 [Seison nebaliae]
MFDGNDVYEELRKLDLHYQPLEHQIGNDHRSVSFHLAQFIFRRIIPKFRDRLFLVEDWNVERLRNEGHIINQLTFDGLEHEILHCIHRMNKLQIEHDENEGKRKIFLFCGERSIETFVFLLSVMCNNHLFYYIDDRLPVDRNRWIIENIYGNFNEHFHLTIVCDENNNRKRYLEKLLARLSYEIGIFPLNQLFPQNDDHDDGDEFELEEERTKLLNLTRNLSSLETCLILSTSGSTGKPKSILLHHRGLILRNLSENCINLKENDNILQITALSFDAYTYQLFGALLNGAKLIIINRRHLLQPQHIAERINRYEITVLICIVGMFNILVESFLPYLSTLTKVFIGGERPVLSICNRFLENSSSAEIINGYGPCETTSLGTLYNYKHPSKLPNDKNMPIGIGAPGNLLTLKNGEIDEKTLIISGHCVSNGYVKNSKNFFNNIQTKNEWLKKGLCNLWSYDTGDVCQLENGLWEFYGRKDEQIKLNGFRVELSEIETTTKKIKYVHECCVVPIKSKFDNRYKSLHLIFSITEENEDSNYVKLKIKRFLAKQLPSYMQPSVMECWKELPRMIGNGKIDKQKIIQKVNESVELKRQKSEEDRRKLII